MVLHVAIPSIWGLGSYENQKSRAGGWTSQSLLFEVLVPTWGGKQICHLSMKSRNPFYLRSWFLQNRGQSYPFPAGSQSLLFEVLVPTPVDAKQGISWEGRNPFYLRSWFLLRIKIKRRFKNGRNPFYLRSWFLQQDPLWTVSVWVAIPSIWGLGSYMNL